MLQLALYAILAMQSPLVAPALVDTLTQTLTLPYLCVLPVSQTVTLAILILVVLSATQDLM